jgi:FkbM family methyltransferase
VTDPADGSRPIECAGFQFYSRNREEFARICHDVFAGQEYAFQTRRRAPRIIDAGAHVGVATHFFKRRYPHARVLAIEANPVTFALLERNIALNHLHDVEAMHAAIAPEPGQIPFYASANDDAPGAWGDSAIPQPWHEGDTTTTIEVPAVTLSSLLTKPVDLLKLDIEGMETAVLAEAAPHLWRVRRIILEFHGTERNPGNSIARLVGILRGAGFTPDMRQFGESVTLDAIQADNPFWLTVRAERPGPWERLRGAVGYRSSTIG